MQARARLLTLIGVMALAPAASAPGLYQPGRYAVDGAATRVHFHVKALVGKYEGDLRDPQGEVAIDPARPDRADIDIRFPVDKLTTGDPSTDAMLKGGSFFDMAQYPTVRFAAEGAPLASAQGETRIEGRLTMHGVTQPTTLTVRLTGVTPDEAPGISTLHFTGTMAVERSHFGMGFGRPFVADRVDLSVDAVFRRS
ncbi:polyisoprenoid-binding protein [Sphingobium amiense]|uniref:Polyisoprenoid-binding protein n=1 Tax=Sphingobium amiense TaxID=135719 RepID=A0A494W468_9SPHN|nr:YceI family protein [Sphingobium amiense]BBD97968.1 polyisoprenoid-binding protein [Sphingobium amiense]